MSGTLDDFRLASRFLDRSLSPEEFADLEKRLTEDPAFAKHLAECSLTNRQLIELFHEDKLHDLLDSLTLGAPSVPRTAQSALADSTEPSVEQSSNRIAKPSSTGHKKLWAGLAAAIVVATGAVAWRFPQPSGENPTDPSILVQSTAPKAEGARDWSVAATVTRAVDCEWAQGIEPMHVGDQLNEGTQVALDSGLVKLTFECGAEVVLQGPCDFIVENSMLGCLKNGNVTASVPRRAFTFGIRAPGIDFVDLGTDFGVSVGSDGKSELHVFEGEVVYRQDVEGRKSSDIVHVSEDEAVKFDSPLVDPSAILVNKELFSSHFELRKGEYQSPELPVHRDLTLWLSADEGVVTDGEGHVVSWQDRLLGDNKIAEDAFQMKAPQRPLLQANEVHGLPVVRFDGQDDYMLTTPMETTDNQTVFIVCQFSPAALSEDRIYGGQILNYDGPPTRELTSTLAPGVLQIGEPLLKDEFQPSLLTAQVWAGFVGKTTVEAGRVDAHPIGANVPVVVCYHYDYDNRKATLLLNGQESSQARAFAPAGLTSRKVLGRHAWMELFFHGDLAELLIFNRALDPEETQALTQHLANRYGVPVEPSAL